ncbi:MAG: hypothetical protein K2I49_00370, partial [Ureaplasma sp.]|nr:hypothetical protein [Ureaplasma sp.]
MTRKQKRILATAIITPILGISTIACAATAISNTIAQNKFLQSNSGTSDNLNSDTSYKFDDLSFDNREELLEYANDIVKTTTQSTSIPVKYKVKNDSEFTEFSTLEELNKFIDGKIQPKSKVKSREIKTAANGEISASDEVNFLSDFIELDSENSDDTSIKQKDTMTVYRGKNNSIHTDINDAKDSYLAIYEPYYFKNIYFRSKEELKLWLENNKNLWWNSKAPKSIVLKAPNGQVSIPIDLSTIGEKSQENYIKNFVKVNSLSNIELRQTTGGKEELMYFDEDHLDDFQRNYNVNYINVESNGGNSNYIIDSDIYDTGELEGPYFVSTSSSLKDIKNKESWRQTTNLDRIDFSQYQEISILSKFFDSVLGMSRHTNDAFNIFFSVSDEELQKEINSYYSELNEKYPAIYRSLKDVFLNISRGKRYSSFYKIPIVFYHTMDQIIYWG